VLLTQAEHFDRAKSLVVDGCRVLEASEVLSSVSGCPSNPPAERSSYDGVAYIIFTSGSTGRPKGVLVPHRGVADLMPWLVELHGVGE
jgi:non-ribosomal peptide synthetase component F